jgi:hypothetical protein
MTPCSLTGGTNLWGNYSAFVFKAEYCNLERDLLGSTGSNLVVTNISDEAVVSTCRA